MSVYIKCWTRTYGKESLQTIQQSMLMVIEIKCLFLKAHPLYAHKYTIPLQKHFPVRQDVGTLILMMRGSRIDDKMTNSAEIISITCKFCFCYLLHLKRNHTEKGHWFRVPLSKHVLLPSIWLITGPFDVDYVCYLC